MLREEIEEVRALRELGRRAALRPEQAQRYAELVARVLAAATAEQNAATAPHLRRRAVLRSRRAVDLRVTWSGREHRGMTLDLGLGGCAGLLGATPPAGEPTTVALDLQRCGRIEAAARVTDSRERRGTARVSFAFDGLLASQREALAEYLLDDALAELRLAGARRGASRAG
jgi:hypothetical protein